MSSEKPELLHDLTSRLMCWIDGMKYETLDELTEFMVKQLVQGYCADVKLHYGIHLKPIVSVDREYDLINYDVQPVLDMDIDLLTSHLDIDRDEIANGEHRLLELILEHGC